MGRSLDLFAAASPDGAWTVAEVTRRARAVIEAGLTGLWVRGEISGFKAYDSGHWYFTLRDRAAQLRCVMWASDNKRLAARPDEGVQVFAFGLPTVWEERGELRLTVRELLASDAGGPWRLQFERARAALERDGLLDPARKRPIPPYPRRIVVVTSRDGAALHDIVAVATRRWPMAELLVLPTVVQGQAAEPSLIAALAVIDRLKRVDVVIVGRGGGSKEDLQAFNSERVARAVAAAPVPVISAVGHETDVTLCDLVADIRAATPSAAAEAATPDVEAVRAHLARLARGLARGLRTPTVRVGERLARVTDRLVGEMDLRLERGDARVRAAGTRLDALSPLRVLGRGYAVPRDAAGRVLRRVAQFAPGSAFRLRVVDGDVRAKVEDGA